MGNVIVFTNLTLDGVMQAPARPDEDRRGGFEHGGWGVPYAAMTQAGESLANMGALLLGRRTYEDFYSVWPKRKDDPISARLDSLQKYVASTTLSEPLAWINSTLLWGDAVETVARLKQEMDKGLVVMGSGELAQSLMRGNLIDSYVLLIHPLVLGSGRRLFPDGGPFATRRHQNDHDWCRGCDLSATRTDNEGDHQSHHAVIGNPHILRAVSGQTGWSQIGEGLSHSCRVCCFLLVISTFVPPL